MAKQIFINLAVKDLQKAMAFYEESNELPEVLLKLKKALLSIPPSSFEPERTFSTVGLFATKIRNSLEDNTLHSLVLLKSYYKKEQ